MNENSMSIEGLPEIMHRLPASFQRFVSIYKEAEKKSQLYQYNASGSPPESNLEIDTPIQECEMDSIRHSLSDIGLHIMNNIRGDGSSSKELAEKLGVSVDTIKRRYKDLLRHGMVRTTRRCGVRLTHRGMEFLGKLKLRPGEGAIVAE